MRNAAHYTQLVIIQKGQRDIGIRDSSYVSNVVFVKKNSKTILKKMLRFHKAQWEV